MKLRLLANLVRNWTKEIILIWNSIGIAVQGRFESLPLRQFKPG